MEQTLRLFRRDLEGLPRQPGSPSPRAERQRFKGSRQEQDNLNRRAVMRGAERVGAVRFRQDHDARYCIRIRARGLMHDVRDLQLRRGYGHQQGERRPVETVGSRAISECPPERLERLVVRCPSDLGPLSCMQLRIEDRDASASFARIAAEAEHSLREHGRERFGNREWADRPSLTAQCSCPSPTPRSRGARQSSRSGTAPSQSQNAPHRRGRDDRRTPWTRWRA